MEELLKELKALAGKKVEPNMVRIIIQGHPLKNLQFEEYIKGADMNKYHRIALLEEPVQAFFMIRPPQHYLPIHHHNNFWGFIIPVSGIVSETIYRYDEFKSKMYIHPTKTYTKGDYIYEPFNVLHKLQNTSPIDPAVTFHIRYPGVYNYAGTMIVDDLNRKVAVLSEKATEIGWDIPVENFISYKQNAFDLEKLW